MLNVAVCAVIFLAAAVVIGFVLPPTEAESRPLEATPGASDDGHGHGGHGHGDHGHDDHGHGH